MLPISDRQHKQILLLMCDIMTIPMFVGKFQPLTLTFQISIWIIVIWIISSFLMLVCGFSAHYLMIMSQLQLVVVKRWCMAQRARAGHWHSVLICALHPEIWAQIQPDTTRTIYSPQHTLVDLSQHCSLKDKSWIGGAGTNRTQTRCQTGGCTKVKVLPRV